MIISQQELQCEDLLWFGIDVNGVVFACTTGGCANVPHFVCDNRENLDTLEDFFVNKYEKIIENNVKIYDNTKGKLLEEFIQLSQKGIYCYDVCINNNQYYSIVTAPSKSTVIADLPIDIVKILNKNNVHINTKFDETFTIEHAY